MLKNIIITNDRAYSDGGAGMVAISAAKELAQRGYNVILYTAVGPVDQCILDSGVKVICLGQQGILEDKNRLRAVVQGIWNQKAYRELKRLLRTLSPADTIVHIQSYSKALSGSIFSAVAECGFKLALTLHDFFPICPNGGLYDYKQNRICTLRPSSVSCYLCNCDVRNYFQKLWRSLRQEFLKRSIARNKEIWMFTISELTERIFQEQETWLKKGKQTLHFCRVNNPVRTPSHQEVDLQHNRYYAYVGRLSPEKGLGLFCEAITQLGLQGRVIGNGYLYEEYKQRYPNIQFCGWVTGEQKDELLSECKALVFPSLWYETYGLVVAESMLMGIPSIVADGTAAAELIEDGKNGYLFKIGDLADLKTTILRYENSNMSDIHSNVLQAFDISAHSIKNHGDHLISAYEAILSGQSL